MLGQKEYPGKKEGVEEKKTFMREKPLSTRQRTLENKPAPKGREIEKKKTQAGNNSQREKKMPRRGKREKINCKAPASPDE